MQATHGKEGKVYVNGYDLSTFLKSVGIAAKADTAETSTFGTGDKAFLGGMREGTLSAEGIFDGAVSAVDGVLGSAFVAGSAYHWAVMQQGDEFGKIARLVSAIDSSYETTSPLDDVTNIAAEAQVSDGIDRGVVLHALEQENAGGNSDTVDDLAASVDGLNGYLQVTQSTGGNLAVKIQHSTDDNTWVDLVVFATVSAAHRAERKSSLVAVPAGTVYRYIRVLWTLSAGTATFHVGASRK